MGKKIFLFIICLLVLISSGCKDRSKDNAQATSFSIKDDKGYVTTLNKKPERILTLSMGLDSIVIGLKGTDSLVAISALHHDESCSNIVPIAKKIKRTILNVNTEEVMGLRPDVLLVGDWESEEVIDGLRSIGLKVIVCKGPKSIQDIKDNIKLVAKSIGEEAKGDKLIGKMDEKLAELQDKLKKYQVKKKVALISLMKTYGGTGCIYDGICNKANVINGIADVGLKYGQPLTKEMFVKMNPDVFLLPSYQFHGFELEKYNKEFLEDPALKGLTAIEKKSIFNPRDSYIYASSQDVVFGVQEVAWAAYGEEFKQEPHCHLSVANEK